MWAEHDKTIIKLEDKVKTPLSLDMNRVSLGLFYIHV